MTSRDDLVGELVYELNSDELLNAGGSGADKSAAAVCVCRQIQHRHAKVAKIDRNTSKSNSKSFIRYGSNACWIHTITLKYKYKLDNKNIKNIVKGTPGLTISNGN